MSRVRNRMNRLSTDQLLKLLKALKRQLNATKRLSVQYRGVVTDSIVVPDHRTQLRAAIELGKLHDLYPRRGERQARDPYDRSERPVINLVMPSLDRNAASTGNEG
jgi:hypothetical protein